MFKVYLLKNKEESTLGYPALILTEYFVNRNAYLKEMSWGENSIPGIGFEYFCRFITVTEDFKLGEYFKLGEFSYDDNEFSLEVSCGYYALVSCHTRIEDAVAVATNRIKENIIDKNCD